MHIIMCNELIIVKDKWMYYLIIEKYTVLNQACFIV